MPTVAHNSRLNFRLSSDLKDVIEEAATALGQSVSDFAISTLVQKARKVIDERNATELSQRDRDRFVALLDDAGAKPNKALKAAAASYKKSIGRRS